VIRAATLRQVELQRAMFAADLLAEAHPGAVVKPVELRGRPGRHGRYGLEAEVPGASVAGDYGEVRAWLETEARP